MTQIFAKIGDAVMAMRKEEAQLIALQSLSWLVENRSALSEFMALTGIDLDTLRNAAGEDDLLASVIEYICGEDARIIACADHIGEKPEVFLTVRDVLGGGAIPHWT
ncbi:MAG: DUF3572 domain-containing protein [Mangrovicoccus sp.]